MTQPASPEPGSGPGPGPGPGPDSEFRPHRDGRDPGEISRRLGRWLAGQSPGATPLDVALPGADPGGNGVSSDTVPVRVDWPSGPADYVVRMAPLPGDVPVFRTYNLPHQHETMRLVRELTDVPVPQVRWLEPTGEVLGRPFFVMDAVSGVVPPDMLPYNLGDSWLFDASPAQQRRLQEASVAVLAELHKIPDAAGSFGFLLPDFPGDTPLLRHLAWTRDWYRYAAGDLAPAPLVEKALDWLDAHCPPQEEDPVLCWGDARIGNILYQDFTPAGVLDWEMAALGPRQLDLAWMFFSHRVFEELAANFALPGMPGFLREDDVVALYEELTGCRVGDLTWYRLYAAVQWAVVFLRVGTSQIRFGEKDMPGETEELILHRGLLERLVAETGVIR